MQKEGSFSGYWLEAKTIMENKWCILSAAAVVVLIRACKVLYFLFNAVLESLSFYYKINEKMLIASAAERNKGEILKVLKLYIDPSKQYKVRFYLHKKLIK